MGENSIAVRIEIKNPEVNEGLKEIIACVKGFRILGSADRDICDLLIMEVGENLKEEFQLVRSVQESGKAANVCLTSSRVEPDILIQAMRAGAREFFPQPLQKTEVREALLKFQEQREREQASRGEKEKQGKIITVMGSKGGVGTTTIAVNLAFGFQTRSPEAPSVVLMDMNRILGEIPLFLDLQPEFNWAQAAENLSRLDAHYLMSILTRHNSGLYVLSSPTGADGINAAAPEVIERILSLMRDVFDFVVIDTGHLLDEVSLRVMEMSDHLLLISTLTLPCIANAKRLLWFLGKSGHLSKGNIKIIMNRFQKKSLISVKEAEESLNQKAFGVIANDYPATLSAINQGKPLEMIAPKAEVTRNIKSLISALRDEK